MPSGGAIVGRSQYTAAGHQLSSTDTVPIAEESQLCDSAVVGTGVSAPPGKYSIFCSDAPGTLLKLNGVLDCCIFHIIYHELFKHLFQSSSLFQKETGALEDSQPCESAVAP